MPHLPRSVDSAVRADQCDLLALKDEALVNLPGREVGPLRAQPPHVLERGGANTLIENGIRNDRIAMPTKPED